MADRVGQQLDNYRLVRLLGAGGFGEVYLAEHLYRTTQPPVAIKILPPLAQDDLRGFLTEARTFRLKHPNIIQVLDFGVEGRTPFIVMEYASNGTLRQLHPKGTRVPLASIVSYVKQVASALQYAHDERLVHRDVKPENMLIGAQNQVLLSDFGIATIAHGSASQSVEVMAGTIPYMAPEQTQGHPRPASDQYALGVVVYEWLCGDRPFHGTLTEIAVQHAMVPPPLLPEKVPTISPDVEQVVMTALAKDPKQRFGSVLAFANALEQASQPKRPGPVPVVPVPETTDTSQFQPSTGIATPIIPVSQQATVDELPADTSLRQTVSEVSADTPGQLHDRTPWSGNEMSTPLVIPTPGPSPQQDGIAVVQPARRGISRRKIVVGLAGLAVVGVAGGGLALLARSQQSSGPAAPLYTYRGHSDSVNAVAWSPDGKRIASGSDDNTVQVWDAANGGHVYTYSGHSNSVEAVVWSPDGKRIASGGGDVVAGHDFTVQVWDAANGGHVYTYSGHSGVVNAVAWSPDGRRIASGSSDKTVQVWDAADGGHVFTYRGHSDSVNAVAWSPDGKRIASGSVDHTVQVWDAANGGHMYTYRGHSDSVNAVAWSPDGKRIASGSDDHTVQVWNAVAGGNVYIYSGHADGVTAVAWSPDGKRITSGSNDKTVQVWDATNGGHVYTYRGHANFVRAVAWSTDGRSIASGSADKSVQVWQAP